MTTQKEYKLDGTADQSVRSGVAWWPHNYSASNAQHGRRLPGDNREPRMLAQAKDVRHMKVYRLNIRGFRGFETLEISPSEHVMLAGEPRAGRRTVTNKMTRCLDPHTTRRTVDVDPWDFHDQDLDRRIDIELTLGELGDDLEQRSGDYLEVFDRANRELVAFAENPEALDSDTHEWGLRVAWRAQWDSDEGVGSSARLPQGERSGSASCRPGHPITDKRYRSSPSRDHAPSRSALRAPSSVCSTRTPTPLPSAQPSTRWPRRSKPRLPSFLRTPRSSPR